MMKLKSIRTQQEAGKAFSMNEAPTTSNNTANNALSLPLQQQWQATCVKMEEVVGES